MFIPTPARASLHQPPDAGTRITGHLCRPPASVLGARSWQPILSSLSAYMDLPSPSGLPGSFYELQVTDEETETQLVSGGDSGLGVLAARPRLLTS